MSAREQTVVIVAPSYVNGTTIAQELGSKGARVVAVDSNPKAIGFCSKFVRERVVLPAPAKEPKAFARWLVSRRDLYGAIVVPTDDFYLRQVAEEYETLAKVYRLAVAPAQATLTALSKDRATAVAHRLGILVPKGVALGAGADIVDAAAQIGFPAILKPVFGIAFQKDFKTKVFVVSNADELERDYARATAAGHEVVLQEIVQGPDENMAVCRGYVTDKGEPQQCLTTIKLASFPPRFGIGQVSEARHVPEVIEMTLRLIGQMGFRGSLFCTEWKRDQRDGKWRFIEFNARSVMTIGIMKSAGVDAIDMMWRDKTGQPQRPPGRIRWGVRHASIKNALLRHAGHPELRRSTLEYVKLYRPPISFDILRLDDMKPFLADIMPLVARRFGPLGRLSGG